MENIFNIFLSRSLWLAIITIALLYICLYIGKKVFNKNLKIAEKKRNFRGKTYVNLIYHLYKYIILIIGVIVILRIFGINVTSILASIGIISVIVGLALQDALKDIIMGFNIMVDGYFKPGQIIEINGITGKVIDFNLKATKIRDIKTDHIYVISNRNIDKVLNISSRLDIDIPVEYEKSKEEVEKVIMEITKKAMDNTLIRKIEYLGINEFGDSAIYYKIRLDVNPIAKPTVKRYVNGLIKDTFDKNNISIPYMQVDIHNKEK